eukprot:3304717-Lingulodinium_polyedra.AAC.1
MPKLPVQDAVKLRLREPPSARAEPYDPKVVARKQGRVLERQRVLEHSHGCNCCPNLRRPGRNRGGKAEGV